MRKITTKNLYAVKMLTVVALMLIAFSFVNRFYVNADNKTSDIYLVPNLNGYELSSLPNGLKGETYPVFECDVVADGDTVIGKADVLVYDPEGIAVSTVNGRFATTKTGTYRIEYFAEYKGSQSSCMVEISVVDDGYIPIETVVKTEIESTGYTFDKYILPTVEAIGGFGVLQTKWEIDYVGNNYCDKVEIYHDVKSDYFLPKYPGTYVCKYIATDIVGKNGEEECLVVVNDSATPIMQIPSNSKICHLGETVKFTSTQAKLFDNGVAVYVPVKTYVNEIDITDTMTFRPDTAGTYTIKYEAKNPFNQDANSAVYTYMLSVVDVQSDNNSTLFVERFLQYDGFTSEYRENSSLENKVFVLKADGTKDNASLNFKNKIDERMIAVEVGFDVSADVHYSNFAEIVVEFCDTVHSEEKISIAIAPTSDKKVLVIVNGLYTAILERSLTEFTGDKTYNKLSFVYDSKTKTLYENENFVCKIEKTTDGREFHGFTSHFAYFNLSMLGVETQSTLKLYSLSGQVINKDTIDKTKPLFIFPDDYSSGFYVDKGEYITIKKLDIFDFYSTDNRLSLNIQAPDKSKLYFTENMTENYVFLVEQYGTYIVNYTIYDDNNNSRTTTAKITVIDRISPTINPIEISSTAKVGDVLKLPECIATDNLTETCITYICLIKGNFYKLLVHEAYTFTEVGDHYFIYGARDDAGNLTTITYIVNVAP